VLLGFKISIINDSNSIKVKIPVHLIEPELAHKKSIINAVGDNDLSGEFL